MQELKNLISLKQDKKSKMEAKVEELQKSITTASKEIEELEALIKGSTAIPKTEIKKVIKEVPVAANIAKIKEQEETIAALKEGNKVLEKERDDLLKSLKKAEKEAKKAAKEIKTKEQILKELEEIP